MAPVRPKISRREFAFGSAAFLWTASARAERFAACSGKPLRFVVGFSSGSGVDAVARAVNQEIASGLGCNSVIDNRPGAGGTLGAANVASSPPDGASLLITSSAHAVNPAVFPKLPYDTLKDLAAVAPVAWVPFVMVTSPAKGFKSVKDVVTRARTRPGELNYGSSGMGSATHLNGAKFAKFAEVDAVHVPYRGGGEVMTELMAGRLDWAFTPTSSAVPFIRDGRVQALAVSGANRTPALPDVPSMTEAGFPAAQFSSWVGLFAPSAIPKSAREQIYKATQRAVVLPEVEERFSRTGSDPMLMSAADFDKFVTDEVHSMAQLVRSANIRMTE